MKASLVIVIGLLFFTYFNTSLAAIRMQSRYSQSYKMALDTATDAGVSRIKYDTKEDINNISFGFGVGYEDTNNIPLDREEALKWFYRVYTRNLNITEDQAQQINLKGSIPMKCIINFSSISIADSNDAWVVDDVPYIIKYNNKNYLLTLSDQVQNVDTGEWTDIHTLGITKEVYKGYIVDIITSQINDVLKNAVSGDYTIKIAIDDDNFKLNSVNGSTMIVFSEGLPLRIYNPFAIGQPIYGFSIGGSEIIRIVE